ncbi:hypothetical protein L3X38_028263 [Prunus dulcis]|uniref:Uncharacterized protein n=1 Tax=Prunus dulcis TaxID=3755 RepID=A0AAD4Z118_PRUDU|nr:hypothetical protein L3X38_028263 [Prunus dulcis]
MSQRDAHIVKQAHSISVLRTQKPSPPFTNRLPPCPIQRKVVDHICLLKAKEDLSDEEEKEMLDFLYTTQYQMRGILAVSLGRICNENIDKYTHAVYMLLNEHVLPYCHGLTNADYESEVEDVSYLYYEKERYGSLNLVKSLGKHFRFIFQLIQSAVRLCSETSLRTIYWALNPS